MFLPLLVVCSFFNVLQLLLFAAISSCLVGCSVSMLVPFFSCFLVLTLVLTMALFAKVGNLSNCGLERFVLKEET